LICQSASAGRARRSAVCALKQGAVSVRTRGTDLIARLVARVVIRKLGGNVAVDAKIFVRHLASETSRGAIDTGEGAVGRESIVTRCFALSALQVFVHIARPVETAEARILVCAKTCSAGEVTLQLRNQSTARLVNQLVRTRVSRDNDRAGRSDVRVDDP